MCGDDFVPRDRFGSIQTLVRLLQLGEGGGCGRDGGVCYSYLAGRSQDSDKHPTVYRQSPKQISGQKMSTVSSSRNLGEGGKKKKFPHLKRFNSNLCCKRAF